MLMFTRAITEELIESTKVYPVVTIIGPRQSGKTTLVKQIFPLKPYVNLEDPDIRRFAQSDPRRFLEQYQNGAILDEIQRVPELLSYIQVIIDEKQKNGMYILTGSHQISLHQEISQSLAGRTALLKLLPLSLSELSSAQVKMSLDEQLLTGCFPRVYINHINPAKYYRDYVQTYLERDVRKIVNVKDLMQFQHFLSLAATRVGQILDINNMSNELGIANSTISQWFSILEASFISFRLQPYFENFGKRIIKTPKLYFNDVGLVCYLLGILDVSQLTNHPLRGHLFENFIILEIVKTHLNMGIEPSIYYFRDSHQNEVDIILQNANNLTPLEIKSSETYHLSFLKSLKYFKTLVGDRCPHGFLIYAGQHEQGVGDFEVMNYNQISKVIRNEFNY